MCHRCWQRIGNDLRRPAAPERRPNDGEIQVPGYMRAPNTPRHCIFNNCVHATRCRIPASIKTYIFCAYSLYIPDSARVCAEHLQGNAWDDLPQFCNVSHSFNAQQFTDICDMLRTAVQNGIKLDFNVRGALSEEEMHFWTGRKPDQFDAILDETPSISVRCKEPRNALGIYLTKLRTGDSNNRLSTLFNMSRRQLERILKIIRECLSLEYVPRHLGFDHIARNNILERNLSISKALFGNENNDKVILIFDGTYVYINKSSNFLFQRQSYSLHKFQNLLKPFLIVCSDGYIVEVLGPYAATKTDANIMSNIMNDGENPIHILLHPEDVFILDRGFRDSVGDIEANGYEFHMPPTKNRNETQLTTEQANESRSVTICRWVVEVVNGRFKRDFKLLRQKYFNKTLPNMFVDFRIAAAMLNHFHIPITDNIHVESFLNIIETKIDTPNILYTYVERKRLNARRANFERIEANDIQNFPELTEEEVILLSLGTYQLKLARSYCNEHLTNGLYLIEIYQQHNLDDLSDYGINDAVWLLRGRIQSRHVRSRTYYCYIMIKCNLGQNNNILHYYCTCLTGRRTMGTCAHIISIIWYLGYARREGFLAPAAFLNDVIVDNENSL